MVNQVLVLWLIIGVLPTSEKPGREQALQTAAPSPVPVIYQKTNAPRGVISDTAHEHEAILKAARERWPNEWEEFVQAKVPSARVRLAKQIFELGRKALLEQAQLEYSPSSPQQAAAEPMEQDSFLIQDGVPYMPLSDAARHAGVHRETLLTWMKNQVKFDGEPLEMLYFRPTGNHFISKRSVERILNRFEWWPSASSRPRGIILGQTEQGDGWLSISDAARVIGIADVTLRKWVRQGKSPSLDRPLDAVRDTSSGYFYIQQKDVLGLAEHVKKFGLQRGGRPQASPSLPE